MRTLILIASATALLMYIGFAAQQGGATLAGAPLQTESKSLPPVNVPVLTANGEPAQSAPQPRRFAPLAFLTAGADRCEVLQVPPSNAGR